MKEITEAITARQAQIKKLQSDVEALQRAARALAGNATATASRTQGQAEAAEDDCGGQEGPVEEIEALRRFEYTHQRFLE